MVEIRDANREPATGEVVFKGQCTNCHAAGLLGAPKVGDAAAWGPRIASGFDALLHSALAGKGAMPPQGGGDFSDFEIARAVAFMANSAGAKFEAKAPAAAASAAGASTNAAAAPGAQGASASGAEPATAAPAAAILAQAPAASAATKP
jgi:mono/diheme cytochrome c family protein